MSLISHCWDGAPTQLHSPSEKLEISHWKRSLVSQLYYSTCRRALGLWLHIASVVVSYEIQH